MTLIYVDIQLNDLKSYVHSNAYHSINYLKTEPRINDRDIECHFHGFELYK